ncbi:MAG: amidohydrolase family protein [Acidobacteriota bacterium]
MRIIDCHVHVQPWTQLKPEVRKVMASRRKDMDAIETYIEKPDKFIESLDRDGIARVGLINYPSPDLMGFDHSVNEYCSAYRDRYPDRIIAFGGLHPRIGPDPEAEVVRLLDDLKLDGIKVHPPHQLAHANDYLNGNERLRLLYEGCQSRGVPIMVHTGTSVFPGARGKYGDPMDLDDVAVDFPDLKILMAHGGRPLWMDTAFHLVRRHRNMHIDLSGIPPRLLLTYFPRLEAIADKCLFGTDWPSPGVRRIMENVEAFLELPMSDDAKQRILAGTCDEIFPPR